MIDNVLYQNYFKLLLAGDKKGCLVVVRDLLEKNIDIRELYVQLFQRSMYQVGELWAMHEIGVAREHLTTTITERMLSVSYPYVFSGVDTGRKVLVSCVENEHHQMGGKMVADIFEKHGWDSKNLGANTPIKEILAFADDMQPDLIALSCALTSNLPVLKTTVEAIRAEFNDQDVFVGGYAFAQAGPEILKAYPRLQYVETLAQLEEML